jgi:hypothetical protein
LATIVLSPAPASLERLRSSGRFRFRAPLVEPQAQQGEQVSRQVSRLLAAP